LLRTNDLFRTNDLTAFSWLPGIPVLFPCAAISQYLRR
jgi:hypothetical protein